MLQSCYNVPAPPPHLPKTERADIAKQFPCTIRDNIHSQVEALPLEQVGQGQVMDLDLGSIKPSHAYNHQLPAQNNIFNRSAHRSSIQPSDQNQSIQPNTNQPRHIKGKKQILPLFHQKAIIPFTSTNRPQLSKPIQQLSAKDIKKQLQTSIALPTTKGKSIQPNSSGDLQVTDYYEVKGGYQVKFIKCESGWRAQVQEKLGVFHTSFEVPFYIEMGTSIQTLAKHSPVWIRSHIQVYPPTKDKAGYVWVGAQGLQGGGNNMGLFVQKAPIYQAALKGYVAKSGYWPIWTCARSLIVW